MAVNSKTVYGTDAAFTITSLNSLASNGYAGSLAVSNATAGADDALVTVRVATAGSGVSTTGVAVVYAYGSTDGTHYTDGVSGADGTQTPSSPTNLRLIGTLNANAVGTTFTGGPFEVARAFGGILPQNWGIVVQNQTGTALAASGHSADYQLITEQFA